MTNTCDAIVVGSGISGGWADKELSEKGLKTLTLERGRAFVHVRDYKSAGESMRELPHRGPPAPARIHPSLTWRLLPGPWTMPSVN